MPNKDVSTWHGQQRVMKNLFFQFYIHFIDRRCLWLLREFRLSLSCGMQLWQQERSLLGLVFVEAFLPSPCTTCFVLLVMGLGCRLLDSSSYCSPFCILCFQVLSFVRTSILFFFSCSLARCFSYIFIYWF